jgi:hypothetical protein
MDMQGPRLFFSYARRDYDEYLKGFFEDVRARVASKGGIEPHVVAFQDLHGVEVGDDWEERLAAALQMSCALLCVYSPTYFQREHCGKEVAIFLERQSIPVDGREVRGSRFIVPVLWEGKRDLERLGLPPEILKFISFNLDDQHRTDYEKLGLRGLLRKARKRGRYPALVEIIAERVLDLTKTVLAPLPKRPNFLEARNAFATGGRQPNVAPSPSGPTDLAVVFLTAPTADTGTREAALWRPFAHTAAIQELVSDSATALSASYHEVPFEDLGAIGAQLQRFSERNVSIVVVVDPRFVQGSAIESVRALLARTDWRGGVLIVTTERPDSDSDQLIEDSIRLVRTSCAGSRSVHVVENAGSFAREMGALLNELQTNALSDAPLRHEVGAAQPLPLVTGPSARNTR